MTDWRGWPRRFRLIQWRTTVAFVLFVGAVTLGVWRLEQTVDDVAATGDRVEQVGEDLAAEAEIRQLALCEANVDAREAAISTILTTIDFLIELDADPEEPSAVATFRTELERRLRDQFPEVEC